MRQPPPAEVQRQAQINAGIVALAATQTAALWPQVDWANPAAAAAVRTVYGAIVDQFGQSAAAVSAQFYDEQRVAADVGRQYAASMADSLPPVMLDKIVTSAFLGGTPADEHASEAVQTTSDLPVDEMVPARLDGQLQRLVLQPGRETIAENAAADPAQPRYVRVPTGAKTCAFCVMLASRELGPNFTGYASAHNAIFRSDGQKYHAHCVSGETLVSGPRSEAAYRRLFEGEAVVIHTASGQKLTITPNHPVLTDQGWIPAGRLHDGDNVIRSCSSDAGATAVPHEHQQPAPIENVWGSLAMSSRSRVPGSSEDFHGDGRQRQVEVVWADGELRRRGIPALPQIFDQLVLAGPTWNLGELKLSALSGCAALLPTSGGSAHGVMRSSSLVGTLLCGHAASADDARFAGASGADAKFEKTAADDQTVGSETTSDFELRQLLRHVEIANQFAVDAQSVRTRFDPAGFEFAAEGAFAYAHLGLDLLHRLTGQVEFDSVIHLERISFRGHVFNLQTEQGWYSANNLIVSNCDCESVPVFPGMDATDVSPSIGDYADMYHKAAADAGMRSDTAKILASMRRLHGLK